MQTRTLVVLGFASVLGLVARHAWSSSAEVPVAAKQGRDVRGLDQLGARVSQALKVERRAAIEIPQLEGDAGAPDDPDELGEASGEPDDLDSLEREGIISVRGRITDARTGESLPGVTITVASPVLEGTQAAVTDEDGNYTMPTLPPGEYVVTFYYLELAVERSGVTVATNKTTPVFQKLDVTSAGAPRIEPSIHGGITIDTDYIRNIPTSRTFGGMLSNTDLEGVSFSGVTSFENHYVVDEGITFSGSEVDEDPSDEELEVTE